MAVMLLTSKRATTYMSYLVDRSRNGLPISRISQKLLIGSIRASELEAYV